MSMVLNEQQQLLQDTVREFLNDKAPVAALRQLRDSRDATGYSKALWQELAALGVAAIVMPEEFGGLGFGFAGLGAVLQETGRNLTASPLLASVVLGASAIELGGTEAQQQTLLPAVASGELTLALAIDEGHHFNPLHTSVSLSGAGDDQHLNGRKVFVVDGHSADKLIVVARSSAAPGNAEGLTLVLLDREQAGITVERTTLMDGRNAASIEFDQVAVSAAQLLGARDQGWALLQPVLDRGAICLAAEMLGGATEIFERTLEYIKEREQFDVKIGSFQALQHRCSQMFCQLELCRSAVLYALSRLDKNSLDLPVQASLAKALANDCYQLISNEAVQMHGGMGVTDELDIGLFLKRARVSMHLLGDASYHKDRYASLLGY